MDTALRDAKDRSAEDQATLLKELGYDGIGTGGYVNAAFLSAFERQGLKVFNTYLTLSFDAAKPGLDPELSAFVQCLKGHDTALWVAINEVTRDGMKLKPSAPDGDEVVVPALRELADLAKESGVKIALYPHSWFWLERTDDAVRVARKVERPNAGATFNLCHWLKVEGDRDPKPALKEALPLLFFVSINGADAGDTRSLDWDRLIQPLGKGTYDVAGLMKTLWDLGYQGPVGFQGYGIKGDSRDILSQTMKAWRALDGAQGKTTLTSAHVIVSALDDALGAMVERAEELKIKGVAVVAYPEGETISGWISRMAIVGGSLATEPSGTNQGNNLLAIAYAKAAEMAATLKDSGSKVRAPYRGEFGWPGGLVIKVKSGYVIAAFSGGPSEDDLKCSRAGVEILEALL